MSTTTFSGPVVSDNGFVGTISSSVTSTAVLTINGSLVIGSGFNAVSGTVSAQIGFIPVTINGLTMYIGLYSSVTL
tara:strand:+ start:104 stop:331 length:228 start_codon:yes stop_codon:yes gene_type:complete